MRYSSPDEIRNPRTDLAALFAALNSTRSSPSELTVIDASSEQFTSTLDGLGVENVLLVAPENPPHRFSADILAVDSPASLQGIKSENCCALAVRTDESRNWLVRCPSDLHGFRPALVVGRGRARYLVYVRAKAKKPSARLYLDPRVGVEGLIHFVRSEGLRVVALRWFDRLPALEPGEDLDLLIHGSDQAVLRAWLSARPGTIPIDLYSHDGRSPGAFRNTSYFPLRLSEDLLACREWHPSGMPVPSTRDHFRSLLFHAVYHKGEASGIPTQSAKADAVNRVSHFATDHDYAATLEGLTKAIGEDGVEPARVGSLDVSAELIEELGDAPSHDSAHMFARANPWLASRIAKQQSSAEPDDSVMWTVFLIRERVLDLFNDSEIAEIIAPDRSRLTMIFWHRLTSEEVVRASSRIRGGNWGKGPYKSSGGLPVRLALVWDASPEAKRDLLVENPRFQARKEKLRKECLKRSERSFNAAHSADSRRIALEYLEVLDADHQSSALHALEQVRNQIAMTQDDSIIRRLSMNSRAATDLVRIGATLMVRKWYFQWAGAAFAREVAALEGLSSAGLAPRFRVQGSNVILLEYHAQAQPAFSRPLTRTDVTEMHEIVREAHAVGWRLRDVHPGNFIRDQASGKLLAIDLEDAVPAVSMTTEALFTSDSVASFSGLRKYGIPVCERHFESGPLTWAFCEYGARLSAQMRNGVVKRIIGRVSRIPVAVRRRVARIVCGVQFASDLRRRR